MTNLLVKQLDLDPANHRIELTGAYPICQVHFEQMKSTLVTEGTTSNDCYHCSREWAAGWLKLLRTNQWMEEIQPNDIVYIAGPMTGLPNFNRPAFWMMEHALKLRRAKVLSPARYDDLTLPYEWYMRKGFEMVLRCQKMIMLKNWQASGGAKAEFLIATKIGVLIYEQS